MKIIHLLSKIEDDREVRSIKFVKRVAKILNSEYKQAINKPYSKTPPIKNCSRPECVRDKSGKILLENGTESYALGPGHYGCYAAHRDAIQEHSKISTEPLMIFECDALANVSSRYFKDLLLEVQQFIEEKDCDIFTFGGTVYSPNITKLEQFGGFYRSNHIADAHCYYIPSSKLEKVSKLFDTRTWDALDLFYCQSLDYIGSYKTPLSLQGDGLSLIAGVLRSEALKELEEF